jgi:hypothetical protein
MKMKKIIVLICSFVSFSLIAEDKSGLYYQWPQMVINAKYPIDCMLLGSNRAHVIWQTDTAALDYQISRDKAGDQLKFLSTRIKLATANVYLSALNLVSGNGNVKKVNPDILQYIDHDYVVDKN